MKHYHAIEPSVSKYGHDTINVWGYRYGAAIDSLETIRPIWRKSIRAEAIFCLTEPIDCLVGSYGTTAMMVRQHNGIMLGLSDFLGDPRDKRYWAVMADEFKFVAQDNGLQPAVYKATEPSIAALHHAGFRSFPIGKEAVVNTSEYTKSGKQFKTLKRKLKSAEKSEVAIEYYPSKMITDDVYQELECIDNIWQNAKGKAMQFSQGVLSKRYTEENDFWVARHHGRMVAFISVLTSGNRREQSVDLMRQEYSEQTRDIMYALIDAAITKAKEKGCPRFSLCNVMLKDFEQNLPNPVNRFMQATGLNRHRLLRQQEGLAQFKKAFSPVWEPVYMSTLGRIPRIKPIIAASQLVRG